MFMLKYCKALKVLFCFLLFSFSLLLAANERWIRVKDGKFYFDASDTKFYYKACSMWYAPFLGEKGNKAYHKRLCVELDSLHSLGVNVIDVLFTPTVENENASLSKYQLDEKILSGFDYLIGQLSKRNMKLVVSFDKKSSFQNLNENDYEKKIANIVLHKNPITKKQYAEDATLLAWKLCDLSRETSNNEQQMDYYDWGVNLINRINQFDNNHLIAFSCSFDDAKNRTNLLKQLLNIEKVNYVDISLSPYEQKMVQSGTLFSGLGRVFISSDETLQNCNRMFSEVDKPYVLNVAYPRDAMFTRPATSTESRDAFFTYVLSKVDDSYSANERLCGIELKGWGGMARPDDSGQWSNKSLISECEGETKGRFSIFNCDDSTIKIIKKFFCKWK